MKKYISYLLAVTIYLGLLSGCKKQTLPVPEYPLKSDTIAEALQEWGLSCIIEEDKAATEILKGQSLYNIYDTETGVFVAGVSSNYKDGERIIYITFPSFYMDNTIGSQDYENAITFATLMFGGFQSKEQVYNKFNKEYDKKNTIRGQSENGVTSSYSHEGASRWERLIDGNTCQITLVQPKLSETQEYIETILFASDWNTFHSE